MKKTVFLLLVLSACAPYAPKLAEQPIDMAKYEADRNECIVQGRKEANHVAASFEGNWLKSPADFADECMAKRGYKFN